MTGAEFESTKKLCAAIGTENFSAVLLLPHIKGDRGKGCPPSFQEEYAGRRMNKIKIIFYKNAKYRYIPVSIWFKGQERDLLT